jgi:hypothetical protein
VKHSIFNRLSLRGQGVMYNRNPGIMIVPVMTLDAVKGWDGAGYDALVMAGPYGGVYSDIGVVCAGMGMQTLETTATGVEIEAARSVLKQVVCGLAHSLMRAERVIPDLHKTALDALRRPFNNRHNQLIY